MDWNSFTHDFMNIEWWRLLIRLILAVICGGALGFERELNRHPAGFRTHIIVCLGATLVMITGQGLSITAFSFGGTSDPARLGAQVISGIGFLGAGTILVTGKRQVKGLTTAAGLWASACIGLAIGCGFWLGAVITCVLIVLVFTLFNKFDKFIIASVPFFEVMVVFTSPGKVPDVMEEIRNRGIKISDVRMQKETIGDDLVVSAVFTLAVKKHKSHAQAMAEIATIDGVAKIEGE